jgi:hypothetical protein
MCVMVAQGCQIFHGTYIHYAKTGKNLPINHTIYQMEQNIPNSRKIDQIAIKIYQHLQLQDPKKLTQIGISGLKTCHPATPGEALFHRNATSAWLAFPAN